MTCRPHPIPFAAPEDEVRFQHGQMVGIGIVERVATGHGWPCYLVVTEAQNPRASVPHAGRVWIGHEDLLK